MRVRHNENPAEKVGAERFESFFIGARIGNCDRAIVFEGTDGIREMNTMLPVVQRGLGRIPLILGHLRMICTIVCTGKDYASASPAHSR